MIVADTNLIVYLLLPGEHYESAARVLRADAAWAVPQLWRSEFRNVLALYLRRETLSLSDALEATQRAETLVRGREFAVASSRVLELVTRSVCSAYDCEFVALAQEMDVPLITSDRKVRAAFPETAVSPDEFAG